MTDTVDQLSPLAETLYRDGIAGIPAAFPEQWGEELAEDCAALIEEARSRPDGTVNRGRNRFYFTVHPERLRGFTEIVTQPDLVSVSTEVLGPAWRVIEVAFDVPLPDSRYQPWHRDFPSPPQSTQRRLTSLAFNLTTVTVTEEMGPFEVAPGTQWDDGTAFAHGMFPAAPLTERYDALAVQKLPRIGDMSVRSGLTIHRGTPNRSQISRPVLIVGVVGPEVGTGQHGLQVSRAYLESLPPEARDRLDAQVVDELTPLQQAHSIEGLVMGGED